MSAVDIYLHRPCLRSWGVRNLGFPMDRLVVVVADAVVAAVGTAAVADAEYLEHNPSRRVRRRLPSSGMAAVAREPWFEFAGAAEDTAETREFGGFERRRRGKQRSPCQGR